MQTQSFQKIKCLAKLAAALLLFAFCKNKQAEHAAMPGMAHDTVVPKTIETDLFPSDLLQPTNRFTRSTVPVVALQSGQERMTIEAVGVTAYDTREIGTVSARISGRIEKLYVRYRFQPVRKGQKLFDIFSPELLQNQQNLLFLLQNDLQNAPLLAAAHVRLQRLGMTSEQIDNLQTTRQTSPTVTVFSPYNGHLHEAGQPEPMPNTATEMADAAAKTTPELSLKEGMYVRSGEPILTIYDPKNLWAVLNIPVDGQALVKKGTLAHITVETEPGKTRTVKLDFIEPFFRPGSKTLTVRATLPNPGGRLPVGARVRATLETEQVQGNWLPRSAVFSLGLGEVAMRKTGEAFQAIRIKTGMTAGERIQVLSGLSMQDSVAANAQFLMDSESFVKILDEKR